MVNLLHKFMNFNMQDPKNIKLITSERIIPA